MLENHKSFSPKKKRETFCTFTESLLCRLSGVFSQEFQRFVTCPPSSGRDVVISVSHSFRAAELMKNLKSPNQPGLATAGAKVDYLHKGWRGLRAK